MRDAEKTIGNIIDKQKICHLSSVDGDGFPNTKAMLKTRKRVGIQTIYLTTNTSSMRVSQFRENPKASLYFTDSRFFRGVMILGTVEVLEDAEHKEMIWENGDTMYYPRGVTDPDYCVLKFTAIKGRYYTNFKSVDFEVRLLLLSQILDFGTWKHIFYGEFDGMRDKHVLVNSIGE